MHREAFRLHPLAFPLHQKRFPLHQKPLPMNQRLSILAKQLVDPQARSQALPGNTLLPLRGERTEPQVQLQSSKTLSELTNLMLIKRLLPLVRAVSLVSHDALTFEQQRIRESCDSETE
jgi:hypothetical protein